jgi:hypothetical protein
LPVSTSVFGVTRCRSSASDTVNGFMIEPGSNTSVRIAVAQLLAGQARAVVRVVGRIVDQREHFAGAHVDDHRRAGLGLELLDGGLQVRVGDVLDLAVDRQVDVGAVVRRNLFGDVLDDAPRRSLITRRTPDVPDSDFWSPARRPPALRPRRS